MSNLQIQKLNITSAPGFTSGLNEMQFGPGLNIIFGPNASGKTTTARAMKTLIWLQQYKQARNFSLTGNYRALGSDYLITWERGYMDLQKDRMPIEATDLPVPEHPTLYDLSVTDLLASDDSDFAGVIWQEVMGGIDMKKAADQLGAGYDLPGKRNSVYQEFEKARRHLVDVDKNQQNLSERKDGLGKLQKEREEAQSAQRKAELIEKLLNIRELEAKREEKQAERQQLPEVLDRLTGEEADQMKRVEEQWRRKNDDIRTQQENIERYRQQLQQLHLPENGVPDHKLSYWTEQLREVEGLDQKIKETEEKIKKADAELHSIKGEYSWELEPEQVSFSSDHINKLAEWTRKWYGTEQKLIDINNSIEQYEGVEKPEHASSELYRGFNELSKWLKEVPTDQETGIPGKMVWPALVLILISAAIAPFSLIAAGVGLAAGVAVLLTGLFRRKSEGVDKAEVYRQEYQNTGLPQPQSWEVEIVTELQDQLSRMRTEAELNERYLQELEKLQNKKSSLQTELNKLEEERENLIKETGIAPEQHSEITLLTMMEAVRGIKKQTEQIGFCKKELNQLQEKRASLAFSLKQEFQAYLPETVSENELKSVFEQIKERKNSFDALTNSIKEGTGKLKGLEKDLADLESDLQKIKDKTGCDNSEQARLLLRDFDRNQKLRNEIRELDAQIKPALEQLQQNPEFEPEWIEQETGVLANLKDRFTEAGKRVEGLREEITQIKHDIRKFEQGQDLETARAAYDRARMRLAAFRSEYLERHMKMLVRDYILEQHKSESYPEVFQNAARYFRRFTHGSFELEMSGEEKAFRAVQKDADRGLELHQLSSGTRIQLLLAVRMAFIQKEEQSVQLPLFADELLAVSDSRRADAIVGSLQEMIREGRQIFYFTAQEEEVARWMDAVKKDSGLGDPTIQTLTDEQASTQVGWERAFPDIKLTREIPEPQTSDYEAYLMQLELTGFDPLVQNAEEIPVWMILDDPRLLYECLHRGLNRWGRLENWLQQDMPLPSVSDDRKKELLQIGKILTQALLLYRQGRPYPVNFTDLQEAGLVSEKQTEGVYALLEKVEGHPEKLLQQITNVDGVGNKRKKDIEAFLREHDYLPDDEILPDDKFEFEITKLAEQYQVRDREYLQKVIKRVISG